MWAVFSVLGAFSVLTADFAVGCGSFCSGRNDRLFHGHGFYLLSHIVLRMGIIPECAGRKTLHQTAAYNYIIVFCGAFVKRFCEKRFVFRQEMLFCFWKSYWTHSPSARVTMDSSSSASQSSASTNRSSQISFWICSVVFCPARTQTAESSRTFRAQISAGAPHKRARS